VARPGTTAARQRLDPEALVAVVILYEVKGSNSYSKMVAALPPGFAGAARGLGGCPMSVGGELVHFHDWRAARDRKAATRRKGDRFGEVRAA
jgi:hypothetical protein